MATDYKFVEFVLTSNQLLDKGEIYHFLDSWLGSGLLTSAGNKKSKFLNIRLLVWWRDQEMFIFICNVHWLYSNFVKLTIGLDSCGRSYKNTESFSDNILFVDI